MRVGPARAQGGSSSAEVYPGIAASAGRLLAFAGIAALAAIQWASLVENPPLFRLMVVVAVSIATAAGLIALGSLRLSGPSRIAATAAVAAAGLAASLVALGVPAGDLLPWHWGRLASKLDLGFADLSGMFDYPFNGNNEWSRLLLVGAMPPLLILSALLGFRPARRDGAGTGSLLVLIAAFAIPATVRPTPDPILWGALLLALTAIWLWGRRLRTLPALAMVACLGAIAVPVASSMASDEPLIDYRDWTLPDAAGGVGFQWDHQYGPIDWPRTGTPLFRVESDQPRYWRAEVLDDFFATGWRRSPGGGAPVPTDLTGNAPAGKLQRRWLPTATFSILSLKSPLLISPGTAVTVRGLGGTLQDSDGTVHSDAEPLTKGSEYSVTAYAPDPGAGQMRTSSRSYSAQLAPYTTVGPPLRVGGVGDHLGEPGRGPAVGQWRSRRRSADRDRRLAVQAPRRSLAALDRSSAGRLRRGQGGGGVPPRGLLLRRVAASAARPAERVRVQGPDRLLPAVLRRDGPDAAALRNPGPASRSASHPASASGGDRTRSR